MPEQPASQRQPLAAPHSMASKATHPYPPTPYPQARRTAHRATARDAATQPKQEHSSAYPSIRADTIGPAVNHLTRPPGTRTPVYAIRPANMSPPPPGPQHPIRVTRQDRPGALPACPAQPPSTGGHTRTSQGPTVRSSPSKTTQSSMTLSFRPRPASQRSQSSPSSRAQPPPRACDSPRRPCHRRI